MQLIVLGMHRSGTSVLMRILNLMGAYFGPEGASTGANAENPKGFWERQDIRALNDMLLRSAGCDWNRVSAFDVTRVPAPVLVEFRKRAARLVLEMDAHRPWAMKEPRLCLLLPLWRPMLEAPICVHILRDPIEVASSIARRNKIPMAAGLALWERYVRDAARHTEGLPTIAVDHARLIRDPVGVSEELFEGLKALDVQGLRLPTARELNAFVNHELHRERADRSDLQDFRGAPQAQLYEAWKTGLRGAATDLVQIPEDGGNALIEYESNLPPLPPPGSDDDVDGSDSAIVRRIERDLKVLREQSTKLASEIGGRDEAARGVTSELRAMREEYRQIEALRAQLAAAQRREQELSEEVDAKRQAVIVQNERADSLAAKVEALDRGVQNLSAQLADRNKELEARKVEIALRDEQLASQALLSERTRLEAEQNITTRFREIEQITRMLMEKEHEAAQISKRLAITHDRIKRMESSRSWRAMALFRALAALFADGRQTLKAIAGRSDAQLIRGSSWFDAAWYLKTYPDVADSGLDPAEHYLRFGAEEGRNPGPGFDTRYYLSLHVDVADARTNPLLHFIRFGERERRSIKAAIPSAASKNG